MSTPAADRLVANRYALKAPLGRGGMGVVWRAHDAVLGRQVAIKEVVFPPAMPDAERRSVQARVMREARAAARLNHPAAVTLYDVVQDQGGTFIVMELVDAPTLADVVRDDGPLPPERVAEIATEVAGALEAAHRAGIVHRDVKPGNVMVPDDGPAKLADFGIASLQGDPQLTSTGLVIGSPAYMAPEQAKGEESGPAVDFWALGATMYYAVEGEPPFDRGTSIATLAAVVNEEPRPPRLAGPLTPLVTALLAKDPTARPSGPAVRADLARLARQAPPARLLPNQGPGRTIPLPAAAAVPQEPPTPRPPGVGDDQEHPTSPPPGVGDDQEQPTARSATLPHRGTPHPEVGFSPVGGAGTAAAEPGAGTAAAATRAGTDDARSRAGTDPAGPRAGADGAGEAPPFERPAARPLLPPAPPVGRRGGRMVAVLALLLVGGVLAFLLASNLRSGGGEEPTAAPTTRAGAAGQPSETTRPAASTTDAPETTRAPATTAAGDGLPEGWTTFTNRRGSNVVGVPPGFRPRTRESYNATVVEEEGGPRRRFTVRSTNPANPLPQASRDYRAWAASNLEGFREVRYEEGQTYAGRDGAVVFEYEAVTEGRRVHVSHINLKGRSWGYNVELIAPADQWDATQGLARQFEQAFRPLG
jgi:serine/threonine protein kinase